MAATRRSETVLWALTAILLAGMVVAAFVPSLGLTLIVIQLGYVFLHGTLRYGWRAVVVFVVGGLVISNILENLSIQTGFPFGHYHYTGDGKIFQVPWFIGPAYLATGYLAWVVATALLADVRRRSSWLVTIGTPLVGAFAMTAWDLAFDPSRSTVDQVWIWENGGGFFGVPLVNFLGWTFTVYLFMQVFALYLRSRGPLPDAVPPRAAGDLPAVALYAATALPFFVVLFNGEHAAVTDASGEAWSTADIYETSALLAVYGMVFLSLLAILRIAQRRTSTVATVEAAHTAAPKQTEPAGAKPG